MYTKLKLAIRRIFPFLAYHHILQTLQVFAIILQSILLSGCSSSTNAIRSIYVVSLKYSPLQSHNSTDSSAFRMTLATVISQTQLEVRVGYFGLCVSDPGGVGWTCSNNIDDLRNTFNDTTDPLDLVNNGSHFKDDIIFPYLIIVAIILEVITIILLATFPGWHQEEDAITGSDVDVKPFPSRPISQAALSLSFVAAVFTMISAFWQHFSASAVGTTLEFTVFELIGTSVGSVASALIWTSVFMVITATIGLFILILSIIVLDTLTEERVA